MRQTWCRQAVKWDHPFPSLRIKRKGGRLAARDEGNLRTVNLNRKSRQQTHLLLKNLILKLLKLLQLGKLVLLLK